MKKFPFTIVASILIPLLFLSLGCLEDSECGSEDTTDYQIFSTDIFAMPSEIYWGETSGIRSFTYNFTVADICPEENPTVESGVYLKNTNAGSPRPISAEAGVQTCFGVQATELPLTPNNDQYRYESAVTTIGMQQCFGGKSSATIYPYIILSFNTLGTSEADSLYLVETLTDIWTIVHYHKPK